jgi:hypothetical protein
MSDIKDSIRKIAEILDNGFENTWARVLGIIIAISVAVPLFIGIAALTSLWAAWGIVTIWGWYAVPIFGLPMIGYWQAAGLSLLAFSIKPQLNLKSDSSAWVGALLRPPVYVFFAWLFKYFGGF